MSFNRSGLPGWTYNNEELFELESVNIFKKNWQLTCHESDLPEVGDYITYDMLGERALLVRGQDKKIRAFHNLCRHRGSRLVVGERGNCKNVITCPFHAWVYNLDGTLRGPSRSETFPSIDRNEWGLKPIELDKFMGFYFVRFQPSNYPKASDILERHKDKFELYDTENIISASKISLSESLSINWKTVRDVDNEGYHVAQAHPGLHDLYGENYWDEDYHYWSTVSVGEINKKPSKLWTVKKYRKILEQLEEPYSELPRQWLYIGIFPNAVFGFYPDSVIFYQEIPLKYNETQIRSAVYKRNNESRALKALRFLSGRIDNSAVEEDNQLSVWLNEAPRSSAYEGSFFSDLEKGVRDYHDALRTMLPVIGLDEPPGLGKISVTNAELLAKEN
mgnify:FL=1